jgi:hypothetical protein
MKLFEIRTKWGVEHAHASLGTYFNGLSSLQFYTQYGPLMTASVSVSTDSFDRRTMKLLEEGNIIAVKNYSENEGIEDELIRLNIIHPEPITSVRSGYVLINVYQFTDEFVSTPDL